MMMVIMVVVVGEWRMEDWQNVPQVIGPFVLNNSGTLAGSTATAAGTEGILHCGWWWCVLLLLNARDELNCSPGNGEERDKR